MACPPRWPRGHPGGGHLAGKSPAGHSEKSPPGDLRLKSDPQVTSLPPCCSASVSPSEYRSQDAKTSDARRSESLAGPRASLCYLH